jgi:hypothetical protein
MDQRDVAAAIILVAWLFTIACNRGQPTPNELSEHMKVDDGQQALALTAVNVLREEFNSGACQRIYGEAAGYFQAEEFEEWARDCQRLRNDFGLWQSFKFRAARRCGRPEFVVCLSGSAEFENKSTDLSVALVLSGKSTQLRSLAVRDGDHHWTYIPHGSAPSPGPLMDPPGPKSPKDSIAS